MTEDPTAEGRDCGMDAAAYVLGALEPAEAEAFREHLASCAVCRDEVASFQRGADILPMAAPQFEAPRGLRRRVVREIRSSPRPGATVPSARSRTLEWPRPAIALGAALLAAAALIVGGVDLSGGGGARLVQAQVSGAGSAQLRITHGRGELIMRGMPAPPAGHVYEIWVQRGSEAPSPTSALFSVTSGGSGDVGVPGALAGVSRVMVTPEPDGGSLMPTHAPVLVAQLS